jgi:predicted HTH transcriptional regulator
LNAWYFRNALVLANYNDFKSGIYSSQEYLDRFFVNLLFGEKHILRNRDLHISAATEPSQSDIVNVPANVPVNAPSQITVYQQKVLLILRENSNATAEQMAKQIGMSEKTVKRALSALKAKGPQLIFVAALL